MNKEEYELLFEECYSKSDAARRLGFDYNGKVNGTGIRAVTKIIKDNEIDTAHFGKRPYQIKYPSIIKDCPVCGNEFEAKDGDPKEKQTCGYACANTYFRSGMDNGQFKNGKGIKGYRTICFHHHGKKCIICGEDKIVAVHHMDKNHDNESPENLIPLCPTHHQYIHSRFKILIEEKVNEYITQFVQNALRGIK